MIANGIIHGTTSLLTRLHVASWVDSAMAEMKREGKLVRNAWMKTGFKSGLSMVGKGWREISIKFVNN
jgi:hypothetical protein